MSERLAIAARLRAIGAAMYADRRWWRPREYVTACVAVGIVQAIADDIERGALAPVDPEVSTAEGVGYALEERMRVVEFMERCEANLRASGQEAGAHVAAQICAVVACGGHHQSAVDHAH